MANVLACFLAASLLSATGLELSNLALNRPTEQSSVESESTSDLAVDGNKNTDHSAGSCAHTVNEPEPSLDWWQVDLQKIFTVLTVSVTNRGDCCHERLTNFTVEVHTSDPMTSSITGLQVCYLHEGTVGSGLTVDLTCAVNTIGRYVRIVKYNSGYKSLTLCEVVVKGAPVHNTCGVSPVVFTHHSTGAREPDYIVASHENIGKLDCAIMCLRKAFCNAFNAMSPFLGVVSCELLAVALDPVVNASWDVYKIFVCGLSLSTTKKPHTFTPFNIINILKPEKYSQDESVGSDDSDALRIDLNHTAENENTRQQTDHNIKSPDDDISRSPAKYNSGSADISRSSVPSPQVTTADTRLGYYLNQDPHHGPTVPENATSQGIPQSSSSSAKSVYPMYPYPMFKPAMVPSVYPTVSPYLPPARPQPLGGHPNSSQDVATHASPNCSGRVSPAGSSSDESRNLIPATSPLPPSNPATTKRPRPDGGRTCYTRKQVRAMEQIFSENKYPDYDVIENMSAEIGISHKRIKNASFGTALSCFFPEGASPLSMKLRTSTPSTTKKPRTFTPFNIIDILKPVKYSQDESVGSDDSDSDALHIDLDHTNDEEQNLVHNDKLKSPADDTMSPADDATRSPADDATRSPADDATRSPADDATRSPADDATRSPADDATRSPYDTRSTGDHRDTMPDETPVQGLSPADIGNGPCPNLTPYREPPNPGNTAHQGLSLPQSVNNVYPMYPVSMSGVFPSAYPTYIPPATPQPQEAHLNSFQDPEIVVPRASPKGTGKVSPAHRNSSGGESINASPPTSPLPSSSPATTKRVRPSGGRTCYTQKQVRAMEQVFSENKYPDYDVIEHMSAEIGISHKRIKVWFQNKRARRKSRAPETHSPHSPHVAAMMTSSLGINYMSPMMLQFPVPAMMSPFPGFPFPPMFPPTASFGTALSSFFLEDASPVSMNLRTSTSSTSTKPRTLTPFSIIDILKPEKSSPDESIGSDESDSDALHIDLDHTADEEQCLVQNYNIKSPADDATRSLADNTTRSPADDATRSPADDATRSPADDTTRSPADDTTRSPADDTTRSPADDATRSPAEDYTRSPSDNDTRSKGDHRDTILDETPLQGLSPADVENGPCPNLTPYAEPPNPGNIAHQGLSLPQSVNNVHPIYPVSMSGVFPSCYPTYIPPATPQPQETHLNSFQDPEIVVPRASPRGTGRVSPAQSHSSGSESINASPASSPLPSSSPATTKRPRPTSGRTCFTQKQVRAMELVFSENKYPDYDVIEHMSAEIGIPHKRIKVWFQNKRSRRKSRAPETHSPNSPHVAAMMTSSPGINYMSPMMPQFQFPVPAMMSPFPGFPYPPMFPPTVC
ncbi:zinc finger homeobox protein 4-like [Haliotis rufescens]|uniref:zinc finger homeobox protein 4-like n=1 Tax=Haliotis rufescens TaxID=6454 RepID=UPI00201EBFFA|nr:zinc finger homeobox protein 4-like [Haliotis rufescens]